MAHKIINAGGTRFERVSRWIKLEGKEITPRHSLFDYTDSDNTVVCFRHGGRMYALSQFLRLNAPYFYDENGKSAYLSGYEADTWYRPLVCEIDEYGEYIRLYQEIVESEV